MNYNLIVNLKIKLSNKSNMSITTRHTRTWKRMHTSQNIHITKSREIMIKKNTKTVSIGVVLIIIITTSLIYLLSFFTRFSTHPPIEISKLHLQRLWHHFFLTNLFNTRMCLLKMQKILTWDPTWTEPSTDSPPSKDLPYLQHTNIWGLFLPWTCN